MSSFLINSLIPIIGSIAMEEFFLRKSIPLLYESKFSPLFSKAYAGVILINCIGSGLLIVILSFKVSAARSKCIVEAIKEGDKDAEARFNYPKVYAEGFSHSAQVFNCVQRGHQQALETYSQFVVWSILGGLRFPVSSVMGGLVWLLARWKFAEGYSTGDPKQRYNHWSARGVWTGLLWQLATAAATAIYLIL